MANYLDKSSLQVDAQLASFIETVKRFVGEANGA